MWIYVIKSGELMKDWQHVASGYSGFGLGRNNPLMMNLKNIGPIPVGYWRIGKAFHSPKTGECAIPLTPEPGTQTFNRTDFEMHGDCKDPLKRGEASHGCIVMSAYTRKLVAEDEGELLRVIADESLNDKPTEEKIK